MLLRKYGCAESGRRILLLLDLVKRWRNARRQQKRVWVRRVLQFRLTRGKYPSLIAEMRLG